MKNFKALALACVVALVCAGCQNFGSGSSTDPLLLSCKSFNVSLASIQVAAQNGLVGEQVQKNVDAAVDLVEPICTANPEPKLDQVTQQAFDAAQKLVVNVADAANQKAKGTAQ